MYLTFLSRSRLVATPVLASAVFSGWLAMPITQASAQTMPVGREKVETREFRNKDVERAFNTPVKADRGRAHRHGKKGHKGHKH